MLSKITHRGPDGKGAFVKDELAMGNTRLSLVGLDNGKQPIWNEDHTHFVLFVMVKYITIRN